MTNDRACANQKDLPSVSPDAPSPSDMYDAALRAKALAEAVEALAYDRTDLTDAGRPPILPLMYMLNDELHRLSDDLSELELRNKISGRSIERRKNSRLQGEV